MNYFQETPENISNIWETFYNEKNDACGAVLSNQDYTSLAHRARAW